ncbi:MAG: GNAT family N-acetyltransferase [Chloroflexi bacterium]|nr:GNAT family N-acetyltransferase [Chloroflexota bacterium]
METLPDVQIVASHTLPQDLIEELDHWYDRTLLADPAYVHVKDWALADWIVLIRFDGQWASVAEIMDQVIRVGGQPQRVAGISGVMTHPDRRGQGLAAQAVKAALDHARDELNAPFGLLTSTHKLMPYYRNLGWTEVPVRLTFTQSDGPSRYDPALVTSMIYPLSAQVWPNGDIDFNGPPW